MSKVVLELSMSLDGFIAGPNDSPDNGLGDGGDALFKWYSSRDTDFPLPGTVMAEQRRVGDRTEALRHLRHGQRFQRRPPGEESCR